MDCYESGTGRRAICNDAGHETGCLLVPRLGEVVVERLWTSGTVYCATGPGG